MDANATREKSLNSRVVHRKDRNTWIFTAYAICGLGFFLLLAYYASVYFTK